MAEMGKSLMFLPFLTEEVGEEIEMGKTGMTMINCYMPLFKSTLPSEPNTADSVEYVSLAPPQGHWYETEGQSACQIHVYILSHEPSSFAETRCGARIPEPCDVYSCHRRPEASLRSIDILETHHLKSRLFNAFSFRRRMRANSDVKRAPSNQEQDTGDLELLSFTKTSRNSTERLGRSSVKSTEYPSPSG